MDRLTDSTRKYPKVFNRIVCYPCVLSNVTWYRRRRTPRGRGRGGGGGCSSRSSRDYLFVRRADRRRLALINHPRTVARAPRELVPAANNSRMIDASGVSVTEKSTPISSKSPSRKIDAGCTHFCRYTCMPPRASRAKGRVIAAAMTIADVRSP